MKTILLPIHDDAGQDARVQVALSLSRALGGHLTCLGLPRTGSARPEHDRVRLQDQLSDAGVSWGWVEADGDGADDLADGIATAAGLADLIVASPRVPAWRGTATGERELALDLLHRTRTPILSVPPSASHFTADGRVLVAWNGSDPVIAALRAATPLLRLATRVLLVEIVDRRGRAPAEEAAAYLARHGVQAGVRREARHDAPVAAMLRDMVRTGRFDQVVMGAFACRRVDGPVPDGVSREMLRFSPVPLFLAA